MRLPIILIVIAQFLGCTLWFSVNGVSVDLTARWDLIVIGHWITNKCCSGWFHYWNFESCDIKYC